MSEPFKNVFNEAFVLKLSSYIVKHEKQFQKEEFEQNIINQLEALELKQRMRLISVSINDCLPLSYNEIIELLKCVKNEFDKVELFALSSMVFPDFVEVFGLNDYEVSIEALEMFTIDSSSEFAIRHFIVKYEDQTMEQMKLWAKHKNEHIRRLASEGSRPRLPWAIALPQLKQNPLKVFEILELLKNDESLYVRKSVANNLNDISKDNPLLVIAFIKENIGQSKNLDWILKHGARTLLKQSHPEILRLFGYGNTDHITLKALTYDKRIHLEECLHFSFELHSNKSLGKLRIEYAIDLVRKNNKKINKVFHISSVHEKKCLKTVSTKHSFKKVTTRVYYAGVHKVYILVNGIRMASFECDVN